MHSACSQHDFFDFSCFTAAPNSAVMESAGEAKVFSDDKAAAETSFRQFLDGNEREQGGIFVHAPNCNAAAGCTCSFARLNCSEMTALVGAVQNGIADRSDEK